MKKNIVLAAIIAATLMPQTAFCADTAAFFEDSAIVTTTPAKPIAPAPPAQTTPAKPIAPAPSKPQGVMPTVPDNKPAGVMPTVPGDKPEGVMPTVPGDKPEGVTPTRPATPDGVTPTTPGNKPGNAQPGVEKPRTERRNEIIKEEDYAYHEEEREVVRLCNEERARLGLAPLKLNWEVARMARFKAEDMRDTKNFDHESKIYGSPFEMLASFKIPFEMAGENIAKGNLTAREVVDAWLSSAGHRKNILNPNFTEIGVGFAGSEKGAYWAEIFIRPEIASIDGREVE